MNKLVIFDCDGVLINSEIISNRIAAAAFTALGCQMTTEEYVRACVGVDLLTAYQKIAAQAGKELPTNFFEQNITAMYQAIETELTALIIPVLQYIKTNKIAHCIASNSDMQWIQKCLTITKQMDFFPSQHIFSVEQVLHRKPAPDLYLLAAEKMGFAIEDCLVVEDSPVGIEAALAAKMQVVAFLGAEHAQYDWYQQRILAFNIPVTYNVAELLALVKDRCG